MEERLDLKDRKILYELDINSRQQVSAIAKKIRLNKNTVNFRINRLIKERFIESFYSVVDISKLGYFSIRVYFNFFNTDSKKEEGILNFLIKNPKVAVVAELETTYDIMFSTIVKDIYEFESFWKSFKSKFRKYFNNEKINIFTKVEHLKRRYLNENQENISEIIGGNEKVDFDKLDLRILYVLIKNCRMSALEISNSLKIPPRTVIYRIKQLENKKIIQGYRINLNLERLGYEYYKINFQLNSLEKLDELVFFCKNHKNVVFIDYTISDYDFEIDVEVQNKRELNNIIKEIKKDYAIRRFEIITFKKYHKLESVPKI